MPHRTSPPADAQAALSAHHALVAQLRRPAAWPCPVGEVALIETHISTLLLAGDRVYKLKKPVALGFVDFSTLQARREACEQELRLNRRTAPRWYQAVVPVLQGPDGPRFGADAPPDGPVLDWAVQMQRFDDSERFDRLADQGRLGPQHIDRLAEAVLRLHAPLPPAPPGHGRADLARHWARENIAELRALLAPGDSADAALLAALDGWTEARGAQLAPLMELRRATGHVREGHGDLHLANIVWDQGQAVLFDALEFNDTLRHLDTVADLAFAYMDLQAHGLPRLAWRLVSAVFEANGDYGGLPLLAWCAVYRALVRAKVALLSAADAAHRDQARRYLQLAAQLAGLGAAARRPLLLLTCGVSGTGKSTVAAALAERRGAVRLRSDVERKRLYGLAPTEVAPAGVELYGADATRRTYERLQEVAALALQAGESVVVDAAFLRRAERDAMRALAAAHGADCRVVLCQAPKAVLRERLLARRARGGDASDATPEVLLQQLRWVEWPAADEAGVVVLDTDVAADELARRCDAIELDPPGGGAAPPAAGAESG